MAAAYCGHCGATLTSESGVGADARAKLPAAMTESLAVLSRATVRLDPGAAIEAAVTTVRDIGGRVTAVSPGRGLEFTMQRTNRWAALGTQARWHGQIQVRGEAPRATSVTVGCRLDWSTARVPLGAAVVALAAASQLETLLVPFGLLVVGWSILSAWTLASRQPQLIAGEIVSQLPGAKLALVPSERLPTGRPAATAPDSTLASEHRMSSVDDRMRVLDDLRSGGFLTAADYEKMRQRLLRPSG